MNERLSITTTSPWFISSCRWAAIDLYYGPILTIKVVRVSLCTKKRRLLICKDAVFTYVKNTVHKGEHCLVKWLLTLSGHNFVNNGPNLTILVPIDSQDQGLLIGTKMVKIGPLLTKLWDQQVGNQLWFPTC